MIAGVHNEVLLAVGYAIFLVGVAFALELLARHSHKRSEVYRNAGFVYRQKLDLWECPMRRQLLRAETDYQRRIVHYRAPAEACNACSLKNNCTDSNDGRRLEARLDSWLESELRRFHRGISLALLLLATVILLAEAVRHTEPRELTPRWLPAGSGRHRRDETLFFVPGAGKRRLITIGSWPSPRDDFVFR